MNVPDDSLLCPITLEIFRDPVVAKDGHTYERQAIVEWIGKKWSKSNYGSTVINRRFISELCNKKKQLIVLKNR